MKIHYTFHKYVLRLFAFSFLVTAFSLSFILFVFNTVELLRKAQSLPNVRMDALLKLSLLQLPTLIDQMIPFAFLFSTMFLMWNMYRRSELVVIRAAGFSIWSILMPLMMGVWIYSAIYFVFLDPIVAITQQAKETYQARIFNQPKSFASMSTSGLWVRQPTSTGYSVIHAQRVSGPSLLEGLTLFNFSSQGNFLKRYDVKKAIVTREGWKLEGVRLTESITLLQPVDDWVLPTDLTLDKVRQSFSPPATLSLWQLPRFIALIENAGFPSTEHKMYLYNALTKPFLIMGVCMLGCLSAFSMLRRNNNFIFVSSSIVLGFGLYFLHHILFTLGESLRLPILLSALIPTLVILLLSFSLLIHLEEG